MMMQSAEQYKHLWARQLQKEHEKICWSYGVNLGKTAVEINECRASWGCWVNSAKTIKISAILIKQYDWDTVINVFKHEMAHQIVDEVIGGKRDHGKSFRQACEMIGVPGEFSRASGDLPENMVRENSADQNGPERRLMHRVRKLLALAQSDNRNEAYAAMRKANQLIEQYNISSLDQGHLSEYDYVIINHRKKRIESSQREICVILMNYFFVDVIFSSSYDPEDFQSYKTIELLGRRENIKIAEYVYYFLMQSLSALWANHKKKTRAPVKLKRSYCLGVLKGFREKIDADSSCSRNLSTEKGPGDGGKPVSMSLMLCRSDERLKMLKKQRFPKLAKARTTSRRYYRDAYLDGARDGRRIVLHKGVHYEAGNRGNLLQRNYPQ